MTHLWTSQTRRGELLHVTVDDEVFTFAFNHDGAGPALMVQTMLRRMHAVGELKIRETKR